MGKSDRKSLSAAASRDHRQLQLRTLRITIATHTGFCIYFCAFPPFSPRLRPSPLHSTLARSLVVIPPLSPDLWTAIISEWKEREGKRDHAKLLINSTLMQRKGNLRFYAARCSTLFLSYTSFNEGNYGKTDKAPPPLSIFPAENVWIYVRRRRRRRRAAMLLDLLFFPGGDSLIFFFCSLAILSRERVTMFSNF